ncbi:MAG TPA: secondary thiamine-phosphate synthase enzyme YjbQ [Chloroflexota bacterium]|nr:secondary thiamine-phosphate synthase enzyme YjbQ [Chloroflexota bacterium]
MINTAARANSMLVLVRPYQVVTEHLSLYTDYESQFIDLTDRVNRIVAASGVENGQVTVFTRHTTAAIRINEAEPELLKDFVAFLERVAPKNAVYRHDDFSVRTVNMTDDERQNAHAHCRQLLMSASETIPIVDGKVCFGRWQRIFLVELDRPRERSVIVQVIGQ